MKVTPATLEFKLAMSDPKRGKGLHASDVYGSFYKQLYPAKYGDKQSDPDLLFALGLAWEQYLEKALIANGVLCIRPGELIGEWEGKEVKYSPDLLICNGEDRLGEIKLTWMSSRTCKPGHKNFEKYLSQGRIYAYFTGIHKVRYFVLHVVGDWAANRMPQMHVWDVEFTKQELRQEMRMLMNHAQTEGLFEQEHANSAARDRNTISKLSVPVRTVSSSKRKVRS
jgi:hypothetical protein